MVEKVYGLFLLDKAKTSEHGALLVSKIENMTEDYLEFKYIYNTEDEQMDHKELMEDFGYECHRCGTEVFYRDYNKNSDSDSIFSKYDVRVPTSVFGINIEGLLHEARVKFGYYDNWCVLS